jgi:DNA end-binding protein Ku
MAPPAYWKGYLRLSLVTCAVTLSPATTDSNRISFHNLNKKTGNRLRIKLVDEESGKPVEREDTSKGYEVERGRFVQVSDEELDNLALESNKTLDIQAFVPRHEVDVRYLDKPYFVAPNDDVAIEPFCVIRDAMEATDRLGLGPVVLNERERLMLLEPRGKGILVWRLRYAGEVRSGKGIVDRAEAKPDAKSMKAMIQFIDLKRGDFDPKLLNDSLQESYKRIIAAKRKRRKPPKFIEVGPAPPPQGERKVVSLFEQLKRSVAEEKKAPAASMPGRRDSRGSAARRRAR